MSKYTTPSHRVEMSISNSISNSISLWVCKFFGVPIENRDELIQDLSPKFDCLVLGDMDDEEIEYGIRKIINKSFTEYIPPLNTDVHSIVVRETLEKIKKYRKKKNEDDEVIENSVAPATSVTSFRIQFPSLSVDTSSPTEILHSEILTPTIDGSNLSIKALDEVNSVNSVISSISNKLQKRVSSIVDQKGMSLIDIYELLIITQAEGEQNLINKIDMLFLKEEYEKQLELHNLSMRDSISKSISCFFDLY